MASKDAAELDDFLYGIVQECEGAKDACLKALGKVAKDACERNLTRSDKNHPERPHMKDDVRLSMPQDKENGGKKAVVKGGNKTGTLWHLVNDGTYRTRGTHFMDNAMNALDDSADGIIDGVLSQG